MAFEELVGVRDATVTVAETIVIEDKYVQKDPALSKAKKREGFDNSPLVFLKMTFLRFALSLESTVDCN